MLSAFRHTPNNAQQHTPNNTSYTLVFHCRVVATEGRRSGLGMEQEEDREQEGLEGGEVCVCGQDGHLLKEHSGSAAPQLIH